MPERGGIVDVIIRAKDLTSSVVNKFRANIRTITNVIGTATKAMTAFVAGTTAMVLGLTKLAQRGGEVNDVKASFARLTGDEVAALQRLRQASGGTISDLELMARHNQALAQGAARSTEEFARMVEVSKVLGEAFGIDAAQAMDRLADVMASGSQRAARELGLEIKAGAKRNEILAEAERTARQLAGAESAAADAGDRFATAISNARDRLAAFVATSPLVAGFLDTLANIVTTIVGALERQDWQLLADLFQTIGETMGDALVFGVNKALQKMPTGAEWMENIPILRQWARFERFMQDKFFGGGAAHGASNLGTDLTKLRSIFARGRAGDAAQAIDPLVLPGIDVAVPGRVRGGLVHTPGSLARATAHQQRATFLGRGGATLAPGSVSMTAEWAAQVNALNQQSEAMQNAGQVVVASMGAMAEAAIRGGRLTAESVINMVSRIIQSLPGVGGFAGALIGAAGGIVGALFGRKQREPIPVLVSSYDPRALSQMKESSGPERIVNVIKLPDGTVTSIEEVEREQLRRSKSDEIVRYSPRGHALRG